MDDKKAKTKKTLLNLLISVVSVAAVAILSSLLTRSDSPWYLGLVKPEINPPNIAFPIAWTAIYILMIVNIFLLLNTNKMTPAALIGFILTGLSNILWCLLFFVLESPALGVIMLAICIIIAVWQIINLFKISKLSGFLYLPYIIWITFAFILNYMIFLLN